MFETVLTGAYDNSVFVNFVQEFLNDMELIAPTGYKKVFNNFSYYVDGYYHIGNYTGNDGNKIAVFSVALRKEDSVERARTMQRNFVKPLLESSMCAGALVAFYTLEEPEKWRLSFIRLDYEFSKGKVTGKLTPARRYSYLVGKGEPCNTAKQRLFPIFNDDNNNPSIDDLEEAFSVEKVTNEFFQQYCEKYHQLREFLETNDDFMQEAQYRNFTSEQFAKKLLGQIVFLYFIQKKGWLGVDAIPVIMTEKEYKNAFFARGQKSRDIIGSVYALQQDGTYKIVFDKLKQLSDEDEEFLAGIVKGKPWGTGPKDFMRKIFEGCVSAGKNYFDDYLEPLFYTGLNKNRGENGFYPALHRRIPFLNGGLFEQLDNYEWENNNFNIPNSIFSNKDEKGRNADGILDIFDRYNFTMNEDEPMEREVAIDPEMLGKVFENLLDVKDRKSKGAFYTPREIVHYMCQETLINHLVSKMGISESAIRDFILYGEYLRDEDTIKTLKVTDDNGKRHYEFDKNKELLISEEILSFKKGVNRLKELDELLANVKVADLAVGSGAFPLGMLNEIVKARQVLTEYLAIEMNGFQKKSFYAYERKPYDLKVNTIKNCIFACDIEPSAVDIAKLRLWLSIVIDDEITEDVGNGDFDAHSKPKQLPNLECNIICGNSLIDEFKGNKLITESVLLNNVSENSQQSVFQQGVDGMISKLIELQDKLFFTKEHNDKEEIKAQIQKIYDDIILEQIGGDYELRDAYFESLSESSKPFILWQLYFPKVFKENGGFDIVIGNPPYVGEKGNKDIFRPIAATAFGKRCYYGKMDLFYFFFHKAIDLGNSCAEISFITTNYYPTAYGGKVLREDFKNRTKIRRMINFNELKVFESALGQHNMITMLTKNTEDICAQNCFCKKSGVASNSLLRDLLYSWDKSGEYFELRRVKQAELYDGPESYIRIFGCEENISNPVNGILNKMQLSKVLFKEIAYIKQGIVSGADKYTDAHQSKFGLNLPKGKGIFVLRKDELDALGLSEKEKSLFVRKVYKNSQISKYHINYDDSLYVFYMENSTDINAANNIIKYLEQFKPILESRLDTYNENYPWYALHRARDKKILESNEKIVNSRRSKSNIFALETRQYFEQSDLMISVIKDEYVHKFPPKYILALLNSKLCYVWLKNRGKIKGDMLELYGKPLEEIPIRQPDEDRKNQIIECVNFLLDGCENFDDVLNKIDRLFYEMYGLTDDEIKIVEQRYC